MELPKTSMDRLEKLKDKTEAGSHAEVTRNAFRLYEHMIKLKETGNVFFMKDSEGNVKELEIFI